MAQSSACQAVPIQPENVGRKACLNLGKDPDAPLAPAAGPAAEVGLQLSKRQMLRAAAGLFADKTVRSQLEVQDSVPGMTSQDADIILPKLAYIFRSGEMPHNLL